MGKTGFRKEGRGVGGNSKKNGMEGRLSCSTENRARDKCNDKARIERGKFPG